MLLHQGARNMSAAFDQIKQAEQQAEEILQAARDKAATLKKETADAVSALEGAFHAELKAYQDALLESEQAAIRQKLADMDAAWEREKAGMDARFAAEREALVANLVGKVIEAHGHRDAQ